jgi:hypothetical protein
MKHLVQSTRSCIRKQPIGKCKAIKCGSCVEAYPTENWSTSGQSGIWQTATPIRYFAIFTGSHLCFGAIGFVDYINMQVGVGDAIAYVY